MHNAQEQCRQVNSKIFIERVFIDPSNHIQLNQYRLLTSKNIRPSSICRIVAEYMAIYLYSSNVGTCKKLHLSMCAAIDLPKHRTTRPQKYVI
jgi:hypothetical protein